MARFSIRGRSVPCRAKPGRTRSSPSFSREPATDRNGTNNTELARVQRDVYDVVVVGAGNAALCAALAAREEGARVLVLERAPRHARGGNSYFTGGLVRFPFHGMDDLRALIPDITDDEAAGLEVGTY